MRNIGWPLAIRHGRSLVPLAGSPMLTSFLQMIAPSRCPMCGEYLAVGEEEACAGCILSLSVVADHCKKTNVPRVTLYEHDLSVRAAVLALKFGGDAWRGRGMGLLFLHAKRYVDELDIDCIVPVPLHRRRLVTRGYNQAERIARGVSAALGIPVKTTLLRRVSHNPAQAQSSEEERRNRENPFAARGGTCQRIMLVDDVITTGTTLAQAAQTLVDAGHQTQLMLAVARQERHSDSGSL